MVNSRTPPLGLSAVFWNRKVLLGISNAIIATRLTYVMHCGNISLESPFVMILVFFRYRVCCFKRMSLQFPKLHIYTVWTFTIVGKVCRQRSWQGMLEDLCNPWGAKTVMACITATEHYMDTCLPQPLREVCAYLVVLLFVSAPCSCSWFCSSVPD